MLSSGGAPRRIQTLRRFATSSNELPPPSSSPMNQVRASKTLSQVVPVCLLIIFLILFVTFNNVKDAILTLMNVPFALIGGILALAITGIHFSISAGVGFIALFGVSVQNGVILVSVFNKLKEADEDSLARYIARPAETKGMEDK